MRWRSDEQRQAVMASLRGERRRGGRSGAVWARRASGGLIVKTPWSVREARAESLRAAGASKARRALGLWESRRRREATARKKARGVLLKTLAAGAGLAALGGGVALARSPRLQLALGKRMMRVRNPLGLGLVRRAARGLGRGWQDVRRDLAYATGERAAKAVRGVERRILGDDIPPLSVPARVPAPVHKEVLIRPPKASWTLLRRRAGKIVGIRREAPAGAAETIWAKVRTGHLTPEQGVAQAEKLGLLQTSLPPPKYYGPAQHSRQRVLQNYMAEEAAAKGYEGERIRSGLDRLEIAIKRRLQRGLPHPFDLLRKRFWSLPKGRKPRRIWAMDIDPEWVQKMTPAGRARMKQRDAAWIARKMGYAKVRGLEP